MKPIAVIGVGCRFPLAAGPGALWRLLSSGVNAVVGEYDNRRLDIDGNSRGDWIDRLKALRAGTLDDIDAFDAAAFNISAREAHVMDPQQRLLLQTVWEALDDAGQDMRSLVGRSVGVYTGVYGIDYQRRLHRHFPNVDLSMAIGASAYTLSGRISYAFGFQGPSFTVETACSSSLVAIHQACAALREGECELALAGGVNLLLDPTITLAYLNAGTLSPESRCKFGDASGNGYARSEGVAVLALKVLTQAQADGDPIHAVIRSSSVLHSGQSGNSLIAPSRASQVKLFGKALDRAGITAADLDLIEAHGTGTKVGDRAELNALHDILAAQRTGRVSPCLVGSIKTNIGHTESAAGIAGVIKAVLCLKHRQVPASLNFQTPNPDVTWDGQLFRIPTANSPIGDDKAPLRAAVNSFGISGTIACVILESAPPQAASLPSAGVEVIAGGSPFLLPLSARSHASLKRYANAVCGRIDRGEVEIADLAYSLALRRTHHDVRLAVVGRDGAELAAGLNAFARNELAPNIRCFALPIVSAPSIGWVFCGQGPQYVGMGMDLYVTEPVFRAKMDEIDALVSDEAGFSVIAEIRIEATRSKLNRTDITQPAIFAVQVALADLLASLGFAPAMVVGHSVGEVAAAVTAGVLTLPQAVRVICARGRITEEAAGWGKMAAVELSLEEAEQIVAESGGQVSIAAINGPRSITLAGLREPIGKALERAAAWGRFAQLLDVDYPSHCSLLDPLIPKMAAACAEIRNSPPTVPLYSTVLGRKVDIADFTPNYWARNLREPVLFADALTKMAQDGVDLLVEISPHPVLSYSMKQVLAACGSHAEVIEIMRRDGDAARCMQTAISEHFVRGADPRWREIVPAHGSSVPLPAYLWDDERYWIEEPLAGAGSWRDAGDVTTGSHALLQHRLDILGHGNTAYWQSDIALSSHPWIGDHRVRDRVVFPAAGYLVAALEAGNEVSPGAGLADLEFKEALHVPASGAVKLQFGLAENATSGSYRLTVASRVPDHPQSTRYHVTGLVTVADAPFEPKRVRLDGGGETIAQPHFYEAMSRVQLDYGARFQAVRQLLLQGSRAVARLSAAPVDPEMPGLHPITVDACLQTLLALIPDWGKAGHLWLPQAIKRVRVGRSIVPSGEMSVLAVGMPSLLGDDFMGDVLLLDATGKVLLSLEGVRLHRVAGAAANTSLLHEIRWITRPPARDGPTDSRSEPSTVASVSAGKPWLLIADAGDFACRLEQQLTTLGQACRRVPGVGGGDAVLAYCSEQGDQRGTIVDLRALDTVIDDDVDNDTLMKIERAAVDGALGVLQALLEGDRHRVHRFVLVTSGSQAAGDETGPIAMAQSALWTLFRNAALENPGTTIAEIDLDGAIDPGTIADLTSELLAPDGEPEVALRRGRRRVRRLFHWNQEDAESRRLPAAPFSLEISRRGALDGFQAEEATLDPPASGEVQIRVHAAGVNFRDLLNLLGAVDRVPLGLECSGVISSVGPDTDGFRVGEEVIAAGLGTWRSHFNTSAVLAAHKPVDLGHDAAAALPIAYLTAHYALHHLASLQRGQSVLVHSAGGGVGLAALYIARAAGAGVIGTAGTAAKRDFVRALGATQALDSRSLSFADEMRVSSTLVDVVLNSFAGEFIPASLDLLAPGGTFIELGKRDIWTAEQVAARRPDVTYRVVELAELMRETPGELAGMLAHIVADVDVGVLPALPIRAFPFSRAVDALRFMQHARQTGKIVLSAPRGAEASTGSGATLITGGSGGLGLAIAGWLMDLGHRRLILAGRTAPGAAAVTIIDALRARGAEVWIEPCDVSEHAQVAQLIERCGKDLPTLTGVFHLAGVLDDAPLHQLNSDRFMAVYKPKVFGAWSLHRLTKNLQLQHFVLFSSWTAVLGSPAQANHASANAFLDGLAYHRRSHGLAAQSINWGGWGQTGSAADPVRLAHLERQGLAAMCSADALEALGQIMASDAIQVAVSPFDPAAWRRFAGKYDRAVVLSELNPPRSDVPAAQAAENAPPERERSLREALAMLPAGPVRRNCLETRIATRLSQVLRTAAKLLDVRKPFNSLGLDSLTALELRNALETDTELKLPASLIFNHASIAKLATELARQMDVSLHTEAVAAAQDPGAAPDDLAALLDALKDLPAEEALRLLASDGALQGQ